MKKYMCLGLLKKLLCWHDYSDYKYVIVRDNEGKHVARIEGRCSKCKKIKNN